MQLTRTSYTLPWSTLAQNLSSQQVAWKANCFSTPSCYCSKLKFRSFAGAFWSQNALASNAPSVWQHQLFHWMCWRARVSSWAGLAVSVRLCSMPCLRKVSGTMVGSSIVCAASMCRTSTCFNFLDPKSQVEIQAVHNCKGDHLRCCFIHFTVSCKLLEWYLLQNQKNGIETWESFPGKLKSFRESIV